MASIYHAFTLLDGTSVVGKAGSSTSPTSGDASTAASASDRTERPRNARTLALGGGLARAVRKIFCVDVMIANATCSRDHAFGAGVPFRRRTQRRRQRDLRGHSRRRARSYPTPPPQVRPKSSTTRSSESSERHQQ